MKPINLKIKGLNSFMEMQEINFERLTENGLFGIFGPTGSGKSTILDGITLALYGDVSRKSTNYMNTNCDSLLVSYEFQITHKEARRYRVDREFRRDNKTGNIRTKSAIIVDVTNGEQVLEDKVRNVTEKCEEIIGLKLDDFTRTVVLPQGKFSEFLKLEGKERREMLERLFNLQKYGDELSFKLGAKIREENQKANIIEGELNSYKDVSDEFLNEKENALNETNKKLEICREELSEAEKAYGEGKELWALQSELNALKTKEKALKEQEGDIKRSKLMISVLESSLKVKPYADSYENTLRQISDVKSEVELLNKRAEKIKADKITAEISLSDAKNKKDVEFPKLKIKEQNVLDAIEDKKQLNSLINEKNTLKDNILKISEGLSLSAKSLNKSEEIISGINKDINAKENKAEELKISEEFKNKVNEGIIILSEAESIKKQIASIQKDIDSAKLNIEQSKEKGERFSKLLNIKEKSLVGLSDKLNNLNENCPGNQDTLIGAKEKLSYVKERWDKHNEYTPVIERCRINIAALKKELGKKQHEKTHLIEEINKLKEEIKRLEKENSAYSLRESLTAGDICPVCGSKEHHMENIAAFEQDGNLEELRSDLKSREENHEAVNSEIIKFNERLKAEENSLNDNNLKLKGLGHEYKEYSAEELQKEFDLLYKAVSKYNADKAVLEKEIHTFTEEKHSLLTDYNNANNALSHNVDLFNKLSADLKSKSEELKKTDEKLSMLKMEISMEISVEDFKSVRADINNKEKERAVLERNIKNLRSSLKDEQDNKERLTNECSDLKIQLNEKNTIIAEKEKNIEEKRNIIISKAGTAENLELIKAQIAGAILQLENKLNECEKKKNEAEELFNRINSRIISMQGNLLSLQERSIKDKDMLDKVLAEEGIKDLDEAKKNFYPKSEIDRLKTKIENYGNAVAEIKGAFTSLNMKINNRNLTAEQWDEIQKTKNEKALMVDELQKTATSIEVELKSLVVRLKVKNELLKEKQRSDRSMALLNDLDKLFRGKKFVEFVAANQLKYVSVEASKRLKEITGGTYGLEADENGKFLIRDYKNGGAQRDATTLSGGETFVASLALALALSSQIQLKGTAPLELFFLDEGFGTLDDNLLDIVMDSLEKIHHKRLSIGIISHVESIKNRVPVKLTVSPAAAGLGGSKVKIERS